MNRKSFVSGVLSRILAVIAEEGAADVSVRLTAGHLTLDADLGTSPSERPTPASARAPSEPRASSVSPDTLVEVLSKHPAGLTLLALARAVGQDRRELRPVVADLVRSGRLQKAYGKLRLPGQVRRGRPPGKTLRQVSKKSMPPARKPEKASASGSKTAKMAPKKANSAKPLPRVKKLPVASKPSPRKPAPRRPSRPSPARANKPTEGTPADTGQSDPGDVSASAATGEAVS